MRKFAAIDLGTNSMRLLLCGVDKGIFYNKVKEVVTTRVGKNLSKAGTICKEAMDLNIEKLKYFKSKAEAYGAEEIIAIATSAVRDAENKDEFVEKVKKETGIVIKVLGGAEEAYIGMLGATYGFSADESIMIMDVGGGSTEIVISKNREIQYSISIDAGAVRMTERFINKDPIDDKDINNLNTALGELFSQAINKASEYRTDKTIAIGGTATTLAAIYHNMDIYNPETIHNTILDLSFLDDTLNRLKTMSIEERYGIKGLEKERADIIPAGLYIIKFLAEKLKKQSIIVSECDNLEGVILKYNNLY